MASNRRRALRRLSNYVNRLDRRVKRLSRRPAPRRIGDRVVVTDNIDVDAVTNVELAPDSVTTETIAPGAVDTDNIADGAIDLDKIDGATQDELGGIETSVLPSQPAAPGEGDLWIDTSDNYNLKRYNGTAWVSVRDLTIAVAQSAASAAQSTANGKNKVFRQTSAPTATAAGDLWFDTDDDNRIYRWDGSTWVANNLGDNAIASLSASKITAGTIDASIITVSNLNAGNITTGTLAAARIAAGSLDASKITAGTITATQISGAYVYAGNINAGQITAGTLSADRISGGTLSATVSLSATTGTIGGWSLTSNRILSGSGNTILYADGNIDIGQQLDVSGNINTGANMGVSGSLQVNGNIQANNVVYGVNLVYSDYIRGLGTATVLPANSQPLRRRNSDGYFLIDGSRRDMKEQIEDVENALEVIKLLRPRRFAWKDKSMYEHPNELVHEKVSAHKEAGFVAEEVEEVAPHLAVYDSSPDGSSAITTMWQTNGMIATCVAAIKELAARVEAIESALQTP